MAGPPRGPAIPLPAAKCHHGRWYPCSTAGIPGAVASPRRAARGAHGRRGPSGDENDGSRGGLRVQPGVRGRAGAGGDAGGPAVESCGGRPVPGRHCGRPARPDVPPRRPARIPPRRGGRPRTHNPVSSVRRRICSGIVGCFTRGTPQHPGQPGRDTGLELQLRHLLHGAGCGTGSAGWSRAAGAVLTVIAGLLAERHAQMTRRTRDHVASSGLYRRGEPLTQLSPC